jgi:hypothetical protein
MRWIIALGHHLNAFCQAVELEVPAPVTGSGKALAAPVYSSSAMYDFTKSRNSLVAMS